MLTTFAAHSYFMPWYLFLALLWSTLLLEMPAIRILLRRNFFSNFVLGLLAHLMLPAVVLALASVLGWGKISNLTLKGFTIEISHQVDILSSGYWLLCGGMATVMIGLKTALFFRLAAKPPRIFSISFLAVLCFLSTSLFLTSIAVDRTQVMAYAYARAMGRRLPAGILNRESDPIKAAEPLLNYYNDLNHARQKAH